MNQSIDGNNSSDMMPYNSGLWVISSLWYVSYAY